MTTPTLTTGSNRVVKPWPALWALVIGFFMILVDTTIVSVANPAIKEALDPSTTNLDNVMWVTSAYLLAYAVPLLVTGRMGDRFGPKNLYLTGLVIFTLASLWCGLSDSLVMLIIARAVQGLGAALMSPQTMAVITRMFPPHQRGAAMGLWGATAGVATLVGPIAGGLLVDGPGWEWIFIINVPIGVIAFVLAWRLVPSFPTHAHSFDIPGVIVSGIGLFLLVFGLQEGEHYAWAPWVWAMVVAGVVLLVVFVFMQSRTKNEPLVPLSLFQDRNFSVSNIAITTVGFAVTSMMVPLMYFFQLSLGRTSTEAALYMVPMAVISGVLAPFAGKLLDRTDPRLLLVPGLLLVAISIFAYGFAMNLDTPDWVFLVISGVMGVGQAGMWGPLATSATRNLPGRLAGAGSGVYNTTRQIGSVIGSAAIAAVMQSRMNAELGTSDVGGGFSAGGMPPQLAEPFATAMGQSMMVPAAVMLLGVIAVCFMQKPKHLVKQD